MYRTGHYVAVCINFFSTAAIYSIAKTFPRDSNSTRKDTPMNTKHRQTCVLTLALIISIASFAAAQNSGFEATNLVSDIQGIAERVDSNLVNPWGIVASPSNTIWIADNGTGVSTLYSPSGAKFPPGNPLVVTIPASALST